jgi:choline dehydrogenase-like flavoprotein
VDTETYDACIVGSGAGGGAVAYALTLAGYRVLVLEKGPHYTDRDFFHDELTVCRRNFFVPSPLDEPHVVVREPDSKPERSADAWIACCVGGGTVHMGGYFFRMREEDFRLRTAFGNVKGASVADWPISLAEMEPFYDEVERIIGVSGDAAREGRVKPYPLSPIISHPSAELVDAACAKLDVRTFPTPRAIISADYAGRPACHYCGFCGSYGCEVGAKSSTLATFIALAQATGKLELVSRAMVERIELDEKGRAAGAVYVDAKGVRRAAHARVTVVACSAVETARLLLGSATGRHPAGLGNSSGHLGKNMMFASFASAYGRFALPSPAFPESAQIMPFLDRAVLDWYVAPKAALSHPKAGSLLFMLSHKNPIFQAERQAKTPDGPPVFGAELKRRMREFFLDTRTIEVEAFGESLPHPGCDVTLDPDTKDRFGLPVARIRMGLHPASLAASDFLAARARQILEACSPRNVGSYPGSRLYTVLQAGTARMAKRREDGVLDPTGRLHDVPNLYVADSSGFPSSSGAPFTLTIMANALRVASHIVARGAKGEL